MSIVPPDTLGEILIDKGFAPNDFVLDLNHSLTVPSKMELPVANCNDDRPDAQ